MNFSCSMMSGMLHDLLGILIVTISTTSCACWLCLHIALSLLAIKHQWSLTPAIKQNPSTKIRSNPKKPTNNGE